MLLTDASGSDLPVITVSDQGTIAIVPLPEINPSLSDAINKPFAWLSASGSLLFGPSGIQYNFDTSGNMKMALTIDNDSSIRAEYVVNLVNSNNAYISPSGTTDFRVLTSVNNVTISDSTYKVHNSAYQGQETLPVKLTKAISDICNITPSNMAFMITGVGLSISDSISTMLKTPSTQVAIAKALLNKTGTAPFTDRSAGVVRFAQFNQNVPVMVLCKMASLQFSYMKASQLNTVIVKDITFGLNIL